MSALRVVGVRQTSIDVFHDIERNGLLSLRRLQVYRALFHHGPLTGAQVAEIVKAEHGAWGHSETIRNRLTELRDMGCVDELGVVDCPTNGRRVTLWDVNSNLPKKLEKPESKAKAMVRRIRSEVSQVFLGNELAAAMDRLLGVK